MKKCIMVVVALLYSFIGVNMVFADTWTQKTDFGGIGRDAAVGFSIGNKGYIGTGYVYDPNNPVLKDMHLKDFWEYDPAADTWTQKADFGGGIRCSAVGFSIGNKGYVGTGDVVSWEQDSKDFWEYNPVANIWTQKADFGGGTRYFAAGFSIGNKGYIGTGNRIGGFDGLDGAGPKVFWEYNPATDRWTRKADFGGGIRHIAKGFSIGNKGYIGWGQDEGGTFQKDFWEYDPATDRWTQKADHDVAMDAPAAFSIGNKGYVGTGAVRDENNNLIPINNFWEYDPATDTWTKKADVGGEERAFAAAFSIGNKGYIGTGVFLSAPDLLGFAKDFWEYDTGSCTTPPVISSLTASPDTHMVPVTVSAVVSDACGDPSPETKIISVTSNHPPNSDAVANGQAVITGDLTLNLLAARPNWRLNERVYTITVQSQDSLGNVATRTVRVRERDL